MLSRIQKDLVAGMIVALLFIVFSLPMLYNLTDKVFEKVRLSTIEGRVPTLAGIVIHGAVAGAVYMVLLSLMKH